MATGPGARRVRWRRGSIAWGLVALFALSSCGGTPYDFVGSPDRKAFFKIPMGWKRFPKRDLLIASGQSLSEVTDQSIPWLVAYDAAPRPSLDHVLKLAEAPSHPVIMAQAVNLDFAQRDQVSLASIRNHIYPVDELIESERAEILNYDELVLEEGFRGIEIEYNVVTEGIGTIAAGNEVIRVKQIGVLDPASETMYLILIRCESHCYRDNGKTIEQIAESWTVKEH